MVPNDLTPAYSAFVARQPVAAKAAAPGALSSVVKSAARFWRLSKWRRQTARDARSFSSIPYDVLKDLYVVRYGALNHSV